MDECGDIVLFNSYIPHRSGPNLLKEPRKAIYLTYNSSEDGYLRDEYYINKAYMDGMESSLDEGFKTNEEMVFWMVEKRYSRTK